MAPDKTAHHSVFNPTRNVRNDFGLRLHTDNIAVCPKLDLLLYTSQVWTRSENENISASSRYTFLMIYV